MGLYKGQSQHKFDGYPTGELTHTRGPDLTSRQLRREAERLARKNAKKQQSAQNGFLN